MLMLIEFCAYCRRILFNQNKIQNAGDSYPCVKFRRHIPFFLPKTKPLKIKKKILKHLNKTTVIKKSNHISVFINTFTKCGQ